MKNIYFVGCSDYIAADDEEQACKVWAEVSDESLDDYPDLAIELVKRSEVIKVWIDVYNQDELITKSAGAWAAGADHPKIICSLNW